MKAAEGGTARAQLNVGNLSFDGIGTKKDLTQALSWYQKAAAKGEPNAQNNLGWMYSKGLGVAQDYGQAVHWLARAALQGDSLALSNLPASISKLPALKVETSVAVHSQESSSSAVVGTLEAGAVVYKLHTSEGWYEVYCNDHQTGYVPVSAVQALPFVADKVQPPHLLNLPNTSLQ